MFLHNFSNVHGVIKEFNLKGDELTGATILLAAYGTDNYSGSAFVLFKKDNKLYEVNGGHCSCYGLEDQWSPEETTKDSLLFRMNNGSLGYDDWSGNLFHNELKEILNKME